MLKFSKKVKIIFILFIILIGINTIVLATDINMNLPSDDVTTYENGTGTNNIDDTTSTNEIQNDNSDIIDATDMSEPQDDVGGTAAPSDVSSIAQENMSFSNILNILLIAVGVILILLAIAILIRLRS